MPEVLQVETRKSRGKRHARRQRAAGRIPGVLYGHGQEVVPLSVDATAMSTALRHGARLVELAGAVQESALIRDVQWDTFGIDVLHVDFARVSADERIELLVKVDLKGAAPGTKEGGVVQHLVHEVRISCPAGQIPEKLVMNINQLGLDQSMTADQIELPPGAELLSAPDIVVVQCEMPQTEEEAAAAPMAAEPELIGRKPDEEAEEEA